MSIALFSCDKEEVEVPVSEVGILEENVQKSNEVIATIDTILNEQQFVVPNREVFVNIRNRGERILYHNGPSKAVLIWHASTNGGTADFENPDFKGRKVVNPNEIGEIFIPTELIGGFARIRIKRKK